MLLHPSNMRGYGFTSGSRQGYMEDQLFPVQLLFPLYDTGAIEENDQV